MRRFALLAALVVAVLGGCSTNPATGRSQWILVSPEQIQAMGVQAKPELVAQYGGEVPELALRAYVDSVGRRLLPYVESNYAGLPWEFTTLNSDVINAFALPGGKVFICRGLLRELESEAELAAVLGHEIGHVSGRHVDERISQQLTIELGVAAVGTYTGSDLAAATAHMFANGYSLKFGRDQETESDDLGLKYMVRAGYDPEAMLALLAVLEEASRGNNQPEMLSTHPHPESRIEFVEKKIAGRYSYTQNNPDFQLHTGRWEREALPYLRR